MSGSKIFKGTLIISAALMTSRVLGVFRDMLLAHLAGLSAEKNAYDLAFLVPDIFNHVISTGYLSITFIPIFTGHIVKNREERAWQFFTRVARLFTVAIAALLVLCWIYMKPLLLLLTVTDPDPYTLNQAVHYSRIILPSQLCFFYGSLFIAVQHVKFRFAIPALMGLLYNLSIISGGWLGRERGLEGFAWGVLVGAAVGGFLLQFIGARRSGLQWQWRGPWWDEDVKRYLLLTLPLVCGLGAVFALEFVFRSFGSRWGETGISSLGFAYRVMYTLAGVFGFAVGAASYPMLAKYAKKEEWGSMNRLLSQSASQLAALLIPASVLTWWLAHPIIQLLFERGAFGPEDTRRVAELLRIYIWAGLFLSLQIILLRCFYAREKMWLPTLINTGIFAATLPFYPLASSLWGIEGIPLVGSLGACLQAAALFTTWGFTTGWWHLKEFLFDLGKVAGLSICVFAALRMWAQLPQSISQNGSPLQSLVLLGLVGGGGMLCLTGFQWLLGVKATRSLAQRFTGR